ncbi:MAG: LCP family protein [Halanaerobiales bacterium]
MEKILSRKKILITLVIIIAILIVSVIFYFLNDEFSAVKDDPFSTSKINILALGYDSSVNGPPRADTIMIISLDLDNSEAGVLFVPRDTRVNIPGHGLDRINASHAYGGVELTKKTLESFLNISIDYYVETDFTGFSKIIDAIGGVKVYIEKPLYYEDEAGDLEIDLPDGRVELDGEEALEYVRYRGATKGDIGRVERQQKFIRALVDKLLQPEMVVKIPKLYNETKKAVNTDIPYKDISPFVKSAKEMDLNNIQTDMVPGKAEYIDGASYWLADQEKLEIIVNNMIRSKEYIKNSSYELSIYNGNGEPGLAGKAADRLKKYGFKINIIANARTFDYENTLIKYYEEDSREKARGIKEIIGGKVEYSDEDRDKQIQIILGKDFMLKSEKNQDEENNN